MEYKTIKLTIKWATNSFYFYKVIPILATSNTYLA